MVKSLGIIDSNNVSVTIDDESAIDKTFILQLIEVSTNRVISELEITVLDVV